MRIEWRNRNHEDDALIAVEENSNVVQEAWEADATLLTDFLNDMNGLDANTGTLDVKLRDPQEWGELVVARMDDGDIVSFDPELYWDRVTYWFRSRGDDPHPWSRRR
jgi:hypothetical protein